MLGQGTGRLRKAGRGNRKLRHGDNFSVVHWEFDWSWGGRQETRPRGWNASWGLKFKGWGLASNPLPRQGWATSSSQWSVSKTGSVSSLPGSVGPCLGYLLQRVRLPDVRLHPWTTGMGLPWTPWDSPHTLHEQNDKPFYGQQLIFLGFVCYCNQLMNADFRCLGAKHHITYMSSLSQRGIIPFFTAHPHAQSTHWKWKWKVKVTQSCPILWNPMDCSLPGSSVHGILQARILEWVANPFSRGSSWPSNRTRVSSIAGRFFTVWASRDGA